MKKSKLITLIILCPLFGIWFNEAIFKTGLGISVPITLLLYYGILFWYNKGEGLNTVALWLSVPAFLLSLSFFLHYNITSMLFAFPTLLLLLLVQTLYLFDKEAKDFLGFRYFTIFLSKIFVYPFTNVKNIKSDLKYETSTNKSKVLYAIVGLAISFPFVLMLIMLFGSADTVYREAIRVVMSAISDRLANLAGDIFFAFLIGVPLFLLVSSLRSKKHQPPKHYKYKFSANKIILSTFLTSICLVALSFVIVQFRYLFLPTFTNNFHYSEYARQGFFQLTFASFIVLGIATIIILLGKRVSNKLENPLGVLVALLCALNTIILISAIKRMLLYVDVHGLSIKRFLTLWLMVIIFAGMVGIVVKCFQLRFKLLAYFAAVWVAGVCVMGLINIDRTIAHYNVREFLKDEANTKMDIDYLSTLGYSVIPELEYLKDNCQTPEIKIKASNAYEDALYNYRKHVSTDFLVYRLDKQNNLWRSK